MDHRISIDIKSSWVLLTIMGLFLFLSISLVFNYSQKQENNRLTDNDIKYRFIKASNQVDSIKLSELKNIFTYNRSERAIKELQERVISYEKALAEQVRKLEQASLKEQNGQMKTLIDRTCAGYTKITNKEFYFIMAAADNDRNAMSRTIEEFRGFTSCLTNPKESGMIYGIGAWSIGDIKGQPSM